MGFKYSPKNAIEHLLKFAIYTLCIQNGIDFESAEIFSTVGSEVTIGGLEYIKKEQLPETKLYKTIEKNLRKILKEKGITYKSKVVKEFLVYLLDIGRLTALLYDADALAKLVDSFLVYFPMDVSQAEEIVDALIKNTEKDIKKDVDLLELDTNTLVHKLWDFMKSKYITKIDLFNKQKFLYQEAIYGHPDHTLEKLFVPYSVAYQFKDYKEEYCSCWDFFDNYNYFGL